MEDLEKHGTETGKGLEADMCEVIEDHTASLDAIDIVGAAYQCASLANGHYSALLAEKDREIERLKMWISVDDRLPEDHEDVLVCYFFNRQSKHFPDSQFIKQSCYYNGRFENDEEVTHWMKLPEPPIK